MSKEVRSPMQGVILEIFVNEGDKVAQDDELLILEAMKMENSIYAPSNGTVKEIKVKKKDAVDVDRLLIVLE
ncbi:MAG: acetyl-CoA carboxylase biotin carboxyl carrier protein subunit [Proteobacteria bacterium]|nr:acetyl-CoA carboxylase biotin carboxyl carrier protein subunit [Pseudomonadota bacterium]MBU4010675.1 acetyl-CoA carboxylase biotin carboxyl carrier protein subunit [Pseudomonadota bacterium]